MKKLSQKQLKVIGSLSHQAYKRAQATGTTGGLLYDEWRHQFTADQCGGQHSWRLLEQRHYIPLCNAFLRVLGRPVMRDNTPKTDAAALIYTIKDRVQHWEAPLPYIARIVANRTGRPYTPEADLDTMLAGLDAEPLRQLIYTIERACRNRAKREADALGLPAPVEVHASRSTMPPPRLAAHRGDVAATPLPRARKSSPRGCRTRSTPQ